jgi:hypothetical protein
MRLLSPIQTRREGGFFVSERGTGKPDVTQCNFS